MAVMGWMLFAHDCAQTLNAQLTAEGLLSQDISARTKTSTLDGSSLILYDLTQMDYPHLQVKRAQLQNNDTNLTVKLRGLSGNLFDYFHQTQLRSFRKQLHLYNPTTDLLNNLLMTLAILGEDSLDLDLLVQGIKTAPNQITLDFILYKQNQKKMHLTAKLTPKYPNASLYQNLKGQKLSFTLKHMDTTWKQRVDDYCLSKNLPFVTEATNFEFNCLK